MLYGFRMHVDFILDIPAQKLFHFGNTTQFEFAQAGIQDVFVRAHELFFAGESAARGFDLGRVTSFFGTGVIVVTFGVGALCVRRRGAQRATRIQSDETKTRASKHIKKH